MRKTMLLSIFLWAVAATAVATEPQNDPLNAVVKIETTSSAPNYWLPWQSRLPHSSSGSGAVIRGGMILTNAHNVSDSSLITVRRQNDDTLFVAKVKFVDHDCDLALLTVDDPKFFAGITPLEFAETPPPQSQVVAAGFPVGGDGISLTQGIISRIEIRRYVHSLKWLLTAQVDAAINPGNSGGPVFFDGKVVGIAFQGDGRGESLGYIVPYEIIRHFFDDIKDGKADGFGQLGFGYIALDNPDTRAYLKMSPDQTGIMVSKVYPGTDHDALKFGDVILAIDGKKIANNGNIRLADGQPRHFYTVASAKQIGEKVKLTLLRDGKVVESELAVRKLHEQVEPHLYDRRPEYYVIGGLVFTRLTYSYILEWGKNTPPADLVRRIGKENASPDEQVVLLAQVLADEVNVGYQNHDSLVLLSINGKKVRNLKEAVEMVENCKDEYITFMFEEDTPVTLNLAKLRAATPRILERYRIPADRYLKQK